MIFLLYYSLNMYLKRFFIIWWIVTVFGGSVLKFYRYYFQVTICWWSYHQNFNTRLALKNRVKNLPQYDKMQILCENMTMTELLCYMKSSGIHPIKISFIPFEIKIFRMVRLLPRNKRDCTEISQSCTINKTKICLGNILSLYF